MSIEQLKECLVARGFVIRPDCVLPLLAIKSYKTAVGIRDARVTIFKAAPNYVYTTYESEGRNILHGEGFTLDKDFSKIWDECERLIDDSYARKLFLKHGITA